MKIAIDARTVTISKTGLTTYILYLLKHLTDNSYANIFEDDVEIICYTNKNTPLLKNFPLRKTWGSTDNHIVGDTWEQLCLPIDLKKQSVKIYHGTIGRLPFIKPNLNYVLTIHDLLPMKFPQFYSSQFSKYMSLMLKYSAKRADRIIAVSQSTQKDIIELLQIPKEKITVIYEGVDTIFHPVNKETSFNIIKKHYPINKDYILAVGSIEPKKNLEALSMAYSLLQKQGVQNQLVIVGPKGWAANKIYKKLNIPDFDKKIIFTDYISQEELVLLYNAASMFVFPTLYEGFGLPLLEAMACGTPIAASNTSSIPEIVGDAALLFDPLKIEEIASAIKKILTDTNLQKNLRNKGLERVKLFSWKKMAKETLALYKDLLVPGKTK